MSTLSFLVANPPHGEFDLRRAAERLGMSAADVRIKATYPAPEIWLTDSTTELERAANELTQAGLRVLVMDGGVLAGVPQRAPVAGFAFDDAHLVVRVDGSEVRIPYASGVVGVFGRPREDADAGRASGGGLADGLRRSSGVFMTRDSLTGLGGLGRHTVSSASLAATGGSFFDLYARTDTGLRRLALIQESLDFAGLGSQRLPRASDNMALLVAECEDRFKAGKIDRRLMDVPPRARLTAGKTTQRADGRFLYEPLALPKVLESITPALKGVTPIDLSSRLAFLTAG